MKKGGNTERRNDTSPSMEKKRRSRVERSGLVEQMKA